MKRDWRNIKITDILFICSILLLCIICLSAMSFLMPFRIYAIGLFGMVMYLYAFMKNKYLIFNSISILMVIFVGICFLGVLHTLSRTETLKYSIIYLCMLPILIFNIESEFFSKVLKTFKIVIFLIACTIIINAVIPDLFLHTLNFLIRPGLESWIQIEISSRIYSGLAGEKGEAAMLMVVGMGIAVSEFVRKEKVTFADTVYTVIITIALIFPAKRMLFAVGILSLIIYIFFWTKRDKKIIAIGIGLLIGAGIIIFADYIPGMNVLLERFSETQGDDSMNGRSYLWERAIQMFHNKPIMGYGYGSYNTFASIYGVKTSATGEWLYHAHNVYLQVLAETGIVGAFFLFGAMVYGSLLLIGLHIKKELLQADDRAVLAFAECMQIVILIYSFTGNCLYSTNQIGLFMLTLSILVYLMRKQRRRQLI